MATAAMRACEALASRAAVDPFSARPTAPRDDSRRSEERRAWPSGRERRSTTALAEFATASAIREKEGPLSRMEQDAWDNYRHV